MLLAPYFFSSHSCPSFIRPVRNGWSTILWAWLPVLLFLGLLCVESSAMMGSDRTSAPLHALSHVVSGAQFDSHWTIIHRLVRKMGHFVAYGILSLVLLRAVAMTLQSSYAWVLAEMRLQLIAVAGTFAVAVLDELHQAFVPNRTGKFADVLLDTAGAIALQLLLRLMVYGAAWLRVQGEIYSTRVERAEV